MCLCLPCATHSLKFGDSNQFTFSSNFCLETAEKTSMSYIEQNRGIGEHYSLKILEKHYGNKANERERSSLTGRGLTAMRRLSRRCYNAAKAAYKRSKNS